MIILVWIILGLLAGVLTHWFLPTSKSGGFFVSLLLGISGALVGGYISSAFGWGSLTQFDISSALIATTSAILIVFTYNKVKQ